MKLTRRQFDRLCYTLSFGKRIRFEAAMATRAAHDGTDPNGLLWSLVHNDATPHVVRSALWLAYTRQAITPHTVAAAAGL